MFQSRNRESFLFKYRNLITQMMSNLRFNLVIESLFFSRSHHSHHSLRPNLFQSRNRESFLFKSRFWMAMAIQSITFQSRNRESFLFKMGRKNSPYETILRFNLVIESLFFSSPPLRKPYWTCYNRLQFRERCILSQPHNTNMCIKC